MTTETMSGAFVDGRYDKALSVSELLRKLTELVGEKPEAADMKIALEGCDCLGYMEGMSIEQANGSHYFGDSEYIPPHTFVLFER